MNDQMTRVEKDSMLDLIAHIKRRIMDYKGSTLHIFMCLKADAWIHENFNRPGAGQAHEELQKKILTLFPDGICPSVGLHHALPILAPDDTDMDTVHNTKMSTSQRTNEFRLAWLSQVEQEYL